MCLESPPRLKFGPRGGGQTLPLLFKTYGIRSKPPPRPSKTRQGPGNKAWWDCVPRGGGYFKPSRCGLFGQPAAQCLEGPCHNHALQLRQVTMCELVCKIILRKAPPAHELDTTLYTNAAEVPKVVKHTRRTAPKGHYDTHKFPAHAYFE